MPESQFIEIERSNDSVLISLMITVLLVIYGWYMYRDGNNTLAIVFIIFGAFLAFTAVWYYRMPFARINVAWEELEIMKSPLGAPKKYDLGRVEGVQTSNLDGHFGAKLRLIYSTPHGRDEETISLAPVDPSARRQLLNALSQISATD